MKTQSIALLILACVIAIVFSCTYDIQNGIKDIEPLKPSTYNTILGINDLSNAFNLTTSGSFVADDYTYTEIILSATNESLKNKINQRREVLFISNYGSFSNGSNIFSTQLSADLGAKAFIRHNKAESISVNVSVLGLSIGNVPLTFLNALPETISLESTPSIVKADTSFHVITLTATLLRTNGKVTLGQKVNFSNTTTAFGDNFEGQFVNQTFSDSEGKATIEYRILNTDTIPGILILSASVGTVSGVTKVRLK